MIQGETLRQSRPPWDPRVSAFDGEKETEWCKSTVESIQRYEALTTREERRKKRTRLKCDDIGEADGDYQPWERRMYIAREILVSGCCPTLLRFYASTLTLIT